MQVLLVVDAMTGQDAVNVAEQFAEAVAFDGVVMTKLDGDARGGAALSVKAITGKPILFAEHRREDRPVRALPPGPHGPADPRDGRRPQPDREDAEAVRRGRGRRARAQAAPQRVHARGLPRAAPAGAPDGAAAVAAGDDAGLRRSAAQGHEGRREGARPRRGDHPLDDARGAPPARSSSRARGACASPAARARASSRSISSSSSSIRCASSCARSAAARCPTSARSCVRRADGDPATLRDRVFERFERNPWLYD